MLNVMTASTAAMPAPHDRRPAYASSVCLEKRTQVRGGQATAENAEIISEDGILRTPRSPRLLSLSRGVCRHSDLDLSDLPDLPDPPRLPGPPIPASAGRRASPGRRTPPPT